VSGCHGGAGAQQGLRLDESSSYALLVNVESTQNGTFLRVDPGNPNDSWLIMKLEGTAGVGGQMPLNGTPLSQATIDVIRQWITDGAIDDRAASPNPVTVTGITPTAGSDGPAPGSIVATFDRELDASTVNANTFMLDRSNGDGDFTDGDQVAITAAAITTPATTPMSATFDLSGVALPDDTYRVRLLGSGPSVIMDIDANALDGDGDGSQGGDFVATFTVSTPPSGTTFADVQAVFDANNCTNAGCHSGSTPSEGLNLVAGSSFANLVDVPSSQVPALDRVEPGDPANSYLIQKLEGTAAVGFQMPLVGDPLPQSTIDDIKEWISNGANP
jgi:hypothetical protein